MPELLDAHTLERIVSEVERRCAHHDAAHDVLHVRRVVANARSLVASETQAGKYVNAQVVEVACWLHDIVQLPKNEGSAGESARHSATVARTMLTELGVTEEYTNAVTDAIVSHSFSGGLRPESIEAAIVQDADRLDALGAVGIARLWVTGASMDGLLHHETDPAGIARELDDRRYGLDHIERKLLRLPGLMNTDAGREEARRRAAFIVRYRDEFLRELGMTTDVGVEATV